MQLGQQLLEPIRSGCSHIHWQSDDVEIVVDIEVSDRLGMLVQSISVYGSKSEVTPSVLKKQAREVIDSLSYLDSNLRLIEWDRVSNILQIRGRPDKTEGRPVQFFEIIIDRQLSILLHRRSANEIISFHLSNECFVRLIDELVRIVRLEGARSRRT
jgi:hypothetical protein